MHSTVLSGLCQHQPIFTLHLSYYQRLTSLLPIVHGMGMGSLNSSITFFWVLSISINFHITSFLRPEAYFTSSNSRFISNSIINSIHNIIFPSTPALFHQLSAYHQLKQTGVTFVQIHRFFMRLVCVYKKQKNMSKICTCIVCKRLEKS